MCGKELHGRSDKIFCSKECKNRYNNARKNENCAARNRTITALNNNYRILSDIMDSGLKSIPLMDLEQMGFRPSFITAYRKGRQLHDEYSCFNINYCQTPSKVFNVRRVEIISSRARRQGSLQPWEKEEDW